MARVDAFNKGKFNKDDEYYTRYEDIQTELNHYEDYFKGKTVLCNCDDPFESAFCKFFLKNFNYFGLKRLICTSYGTSPMIGTQLSLFDELDEPVVAGNGYVMDISEIPMANGRGISDDDINKLLKSKKRGVKKLKGDGDFRSLECIEYLKQADIVCTNPPFSLFREYLAQLMEYNKDFLIIGRETSITYKDTFDYIKNNKAWYGYSHAKVFMRPDGTVKAFGNVGWFTNMDVAKRHEELILYRQYSPEAYPNYYNYDGIDIKNITDIPQDYDGMMGVPLSFLFSWNPDQFELIGMGQSVPKKILHKTAGDEIHFIDAVTDDILYRVPYTVPERKRGNQLRIDENGKPGRVPFGRLIIRKKVK
ncbi:adenine-specific methyltransferase EcoRI family protein [Lactococcus cremoris]|uniref:adenine-specific methyltransferase EcoRI family protein n=1 Tax=Lactococcus lactis subsp. cremoris TaxID=1359 RepID=UPI0024A69DE3|nr:adenine-specific methyltransferase EcoRI family protein [Lactococcus cremoris]